MFIRTERSIKEYIRLYPVVSTLIITYLVIWIISDVLNLTIGNLIYNWGVGLNLLIFEGQFWRLITATFLHADMSHALFNSISLVLFGPALERLCGKMKFLFIYLGAGIIGNIASLFFLHPLQPHLGASGCIYGLFGAYLFIIYKRPHLIDPQSRQIVLTIFIIGIVMTFIQPNINIYAHLFGALGGYLLSPIVIKGRRANIVDVDGGSYTYNRNESKFNFDPERWKSRPSRPRRSRRIGSRKEPNVIFIVIIALALLALLAQIKGP